MNYKSDTYSSGVQVVNSFLRGVYNWMTVGLALTSATAYAVFNSAELSQLVFTNPAIYIGLSIFQVALVFILSAGINRMSGGVATFIFLLYSVLNGVTLSSLLVVYTSASIFSTFVVCTGMFAAMSIYGATTKRSLSGWGTFLFMGVIGLLLASIINIFLHSTMFEFAISGIGVLVFTGLTAYDTQKLVALSQDAPVNDSTALRRGTILGALTLYLDFVNLFIFLLRFFGSRR